MRVYRAGHIPRTELRSPEERRPPSAPRRRRRWVPLALLALFALLVLYALFTLLGTQRVVLLGSDARPEDGASRSDTIMIAAVGTDNGAGMLSVPRDTLVEIPGHGQDKINAAFAYGGPELTVETLESFTGRSIGNYVVIRFEGVEEIVDAMGGITLDVQEPLNVDGVSLQPGLQTLNGEQALAYVRYRGGPTADIGRIERQQRFLQAAFSEVTSPANIPDLPGVIRATWNSIETNMNPVELAIFGVRLSLARGEMTAELYPGTPQYIDGISYWIPDTATGRQTVENTID